MKVRLEVIGAGLTINIDGYRTAMEKALLEEGDKINDLFERATSTFSTKTKPRLSKTKVKKIGYDWEVQAGGLRYTHGNGVLSVINFGSGPRTIVAFGGKGPMRFPAQYNPATARTRAFSPGQREKYGEPIVTRTVRNHRVEPRRIDKAIVSRRKGYFRRLMQGRIDKAARRHWNK